MMCSRLICVSVSVRSWHVQVRTSVPTADVWLKVDSRLAIAIAKG